MNISTKEIYFIICAFFFYLIFLFGLLLSAIEYFNFLNYELFKKNFGVFSSIFWQITVIIFFLNYSKNKGLTRIFYGFNKPKSWKMILHAWLGAYLIFTSYGLAIYLLEYFGLESISALSKMQELPFNRDDNMIILIILVASITILAPLVEELLFRGFMLNALLSNMSAARATFISGLCFAIFHLQLTVLIPFTLVGWLFATIRIKSGSLWPSIFAHAGVNSVSTFFLLLQ